MMIDPVISIFSGVPSGRLVDTWGSHRVLAVGLLLMTAGTLLLTSVPNMIGVTGYVPRTNARPLALPSRQQHSDPFGRAR